MEHLNEKKEGKLRYICVTGATATGKSKLARRLAEILGSDIISCDSVQVYRGFNIGSAKDLGSDQDGIVHHLIDVIDWSDDYDAARYARDARRVIRMQNSLGKIPVVVGGTGMYLRALQAQKFHVLPTDASVRESVNRLSNDDIMAELLKRDHQRASQLHLNDRIRLVRALELIRITGQTVAKSISDAADSCSWITPQNEQQVIPTQDAVSDRTMKHSGFPGEALRNQPPENSLRLKAQHPMSGAHPPLLQIYLDVNRATLHQRIEVRSRLMLANGLIQEVESLLAHGCPREAKPMKSIGYLQVVKMLSGEVAVPELEERIVFATRQYAKRQCTWFRKQPSHFRQSDDVVRADLALAVEAILRG